MENRFRLSHHQQIQTDKTFQIPFHFQPQQDDFIKKVHYSKSINHLILIHEKFKLTLFNLLDFCKDKTQQHPQQIQQDNRNSRIQFGFESVPYDAKFISNQLLIMSNRMMPVRIWNIKSEDPHQFSAFYDKKQNSELFLAPIQFDVKGQKIIGGGKKFMSIYDTQKMLPSRFKKMDKKYISTVNIIDQNTASFGQFSGSIGIFDLKSGEITQSIKPHVDAVYHCKSNPRDQNMLITSARKDNFTYIWDKRKFSQFVSCFQIQKYSNQRYGLDFGSNNTIYSCGQLGQIYKTDLNLPQPVLKTEIIYQDSIRQNVSDLTINSEINFDQIFISIGTRKYEFQEEKCMNSKTRFNPLAAVKKLIVK